MDSQLPSPMDDPQNAFDAPRATWHDLPLEIRQQIVLLAIEGTLLNGPQCIAPLPPEYGFSNAGIHLNGSLATRRRPLIMSNQSSVELSQFAHTISRLTHVSFQWSQENAALPLQQLWTRYEQLARSYTYQGGDTISTNPTMSTFLSFGNARDWTLSAGALIDNPEQKTRDCNLDYHLPCVYATKAGLCNLEDQQLGRLGQHVDNTLQGFEPKFVLWQCARRGATAEVHLIQKLCQSTRVPSLKWPLQQNFLGQDSPSEEIPPAEDSTASPIPRLSTPDLGDKLSFDPALYPLADFSPDFGDFSPTLATGLLANESTFLQKKGHVPIGFGIRGLDAASMESVLDIKSPKSQLSQYDESGRTDRNASNLARWLQDLSTNSSDAQQKIDAIVRQVTDRFTGLRIVEKRKLDDRDANLACMVHKRQRRHEEGEGMRGTKTEDRPKLQRPSLRRTVRGTKLEAPASRQHLSHKSDTPRKKHEVGLSFQESLQGNETSQQEPRPQRLDTRGESLLVELMKSQVGDALILFAARMCTGRDDVRLYLQSLARG